MGSPDKLWDSGTEMQPVECLEKDKIGECHKQKGCYMKINIIKDSQGCDTLEECHEWNQAPEEMQKASQNY